MPPEKLISLEFTSRECALIDSLLRRATREFVLLPATVETARKLALRFSLVTEISANSKGTFDKPHSLTALVR